MGEPRLAREYGDNVLVLIPREPSVLFAYWELSPATQLAIAGKKWGLRLWSRRGAHLTLLREVFPSFFCGDWYFTELEAGASYRCELGWWENSFFVPLLVSGWAETPPVPVPWRPPLPEELPEARLLAEARQEIGVGYFSWY
ncbi:DUF4912 domain-containing protein [Ammonifex degensii]|uniref:DUF4912 domain-containing protein n=1 Tax=Ammonifex degensii TaxID=42838 RepID=UPI00059CCB26|nr:DUF4912 domain-containing protein [Ammonifex degensii]